MTSQVDATLPVETSGPNAGKILVSRLRTQLGVIASEITDLQNNASATTVITHIQSDIDALEALLASDNSDLDTMQELVDAIEVLQTAMANVSSGGTIAEGTVHNLGDIAGLVNLDLNVLGHGDTIIFNATENVNFTFINSVALNKTKDLYFLGTRVTDSNALLTPPPQVGWSNYSAPQLYDNLTTRFAIKAINNAGTMSYEGDRGAIFLSLEADGTSTTWNPNDKSTGVLLNADNVNIRVATRGTHRVIRAFGPKNSGKHHASVRTWFTGGFGSSSRSSISIGLSQLAHILDGAQLGRNNISLGMERAEYSSSGISHSYGVYYDSVNALSHGKDMFSSAQPITDILVDFDYDPVNNLAAAWFLFQGVPLQGDPEAGTDPLITFPSGDFWYLTASVYDGSNDMVYMTLLDEVESPYNDNFPSFLYWKS